MKTLIISQIGQGMSITQDKIFKSFWIFGLEIAYATILINPFSWLFIAYTKKIIEEKVN